MKKLFIVALAVVGCGNPKVNLTTGAEACVTAAACGISFPGVVGVSGCTQLVEYANNKEAAGVAKVGPTEVNCLAAAGKDCVKARQCLNGGQPISACTGTSDACTGTVWSTCSMTTGTGGNNGTRSFDCASIGQACAAGNGEFTCATGTCSGLSATCSGAVLQTCDTAVLRTHDCAPTGEECIPTAGITPAHCRGTGAVCASPSITNNALRCDGTTLVTCSDSKEARQDCASLGMGCYIKFGTSTPACLYGAECDPASSPNTCVGNQLKFCDNGKFVTIDCAGAGFTGCDPSNGGRCTI
jgi:hypothetical protein